MKTPGTLTIKESKFVAARVSGMTQPQSLVAAGYSIPKTKRGIYSVANRVEKRPDVQKAIQEALDLIGASPEYAVKQLYKVADQDIELGAKRLAAKDILELHGWKKAERPQVALDIRNAFFGRPRETEDSRVNDVIDTEAVEE